ncbi:zona pellucida sperm-binding protein 1 [Myiozetetes cayanensis]|uniref:zona pellucida sperm-binding protein 1 n=1 Tax=Myiozetetes cayanensis TaxID=478635 RepID=UPI00215F2514|nr:zona pellucida sperm-binding protein 1 [Myiozetetes cayanensis]
MGRSCSFLLLLFLLAPWPRASVSFLRHSYTCGELGMQLLVFPSHGHSVRFKVLDEFGTRFDVANCSICLHRLSSGEDGSIIFSSGYKGCHVLLQVTFLPLSLPLPHWMEVTISHIPLQENRYVLRVQLEELIPGGFLVTSSEVNMTCPKPGGSETRPDGSPERGRDNGILVSHAGLRHHVSQSSLTLAGSQLSSHTHSEQVHTVALNEPSSVLPRIPPQSNPVRPGLPSESSGIRLVSNIQGGFNRPGVQHSHPGGQTQPGLASQNSPSMRHPGGQTWPGLRPEFVSQNPPRLVNPGSQTQPGHFHPGFVLPNHPSSLNPEGQNQPELRPGPVSQNPPSPVHSGSQTQPGPRPGPVYQNPPSPVHSGSQTQPGPHPGPVYQNPPSLAYVGSQTQPGLRPGPVSQNPPSPVHSGTQNPPGLRPGFVFQNPPSPVYAGSQTQPGLRPGSISQNSPVLAPAGVHPPAGFLHPGSQLPNQPGIGQPSFPSSSQTGLPSYTGLVHPGHPSPPLVNSAWPGLISPGLQPGLLHPGIHTPPRLLQPTALFYPSGGAGTQLTREQCQVPVGRMPCVAPQGRDGCIQAGCCYDDTDRATPCYYGNTATVQCLREGQFILVVPRGMAVQPYNLDSVRLAGSQAGCEPFHVTESSVMFRFPVTHCGTTLQVIEDRLIYENQLISTIDVQGSSRGFITRDSVYILQARCIYNASDLLPLGMEVAVPPTAAPLAVPGPLGLQLRIATDESYSSYHPVGDFPLVRVLRDPIFVEVRLLQKTDPNLVLVLHQCWASPGSSAASQPQWPILVDGCPFQGDNYRTQMVPVGPASPELPFPSHYQRFVISTFTFVEPPGMAVMEGEVYISCSASVCHLAQPEPCRPSCQLGVTSRARRSLGNSRTADRMGMVTSLGCIFFPKVSRRS